jgi:hypothetical protein
VGAADGRLTEADDLGVPLGEPADLQNACVEHGIEDAEDSPGALAAQREPFRIGASWGVLFPGTRDEFGSRP